MRSYMQMLQRDPDNAMAFVESDYRFGEVKEAMRALRGYDPHEKMSRAAHDQMKEMAHQFTTAIAGLEADYDVPAEQIRQHVLASVKSLDN